MEPTAKKKIKISDFFAASSSGDAEQSVSSKTPCTLHQNLQGTVSASVPACTASISELMNETPCVQTTATSQIRSSNNPTPLSVQDLERRKEELNEVFKWTGNDRVHHYAKCRDSCFSLSSLDLQRVSREKHRFKHQMLFDPVAYSESTKRWWLAYKEGEGMFCLLCKKHQAHTNTIVFSGVAATRYRKEAILDHVKTKTHKSAELHELVQRVSPFQKEVEEKAEYATEVYQNAFMALYWIAKEEIANRKFLSLLSLLRNLGMEKMKHFKHESAGSVREMFVTIGDTICEEVLIELRKAKSYGILVDDVTDISMKEQCVCFVQYVGNDGKPKVRFLFVEDVLKNSNSANAETIVKVIYEKLDTFGVDRKKLQSIVTDGAAVMVAKNGVAGRLRRDNPSLINVHCICHKLALACADTEEVNAIEKTMLILTQLWKYFDNSAKRTALYLKVQEETKNITLTEPTRHLVGKELKKACATRWLSFDLSIQAVYDDLLSILNTLNILGEKDTAAYGLLQRMKTFRFISTVYILHSILPALSQLSKVFQTGNMDFSRIHPTLQYTMDCIQKMADSEAPLEKLKKHLEEGGRLNAILKGSDRDFDIAKRLLQQYTKALRGNIENRFRDSLPVLGAFDMFNPLTAPERTDAAFKEYGTSSVTVLANHFFKDADESEKDEIVAEWHKLKYHFLQWKAAMVSQAEGEAGGDKCSPTQECLQRIMQKRGDFEKFFPHMVILAEICLTIPVSNAWPERGASAVKRLKTRFRSSIKEDMLMGLMHVATNGPEVDKSSELVEKSVAKWRQQKNRKKMPKRPVGNLQLEMGQDGMRNQPESVDSGCQTDFSGDLVDAVRQEFRAVAKAFLLQPTLEPEYSDVSDDESECDGFL